jgi:putative ABC transport system permease protein
MAVRMAIGAEQGDLLRLAVGREMAAVAVGAVAGLAGAFGLGRAMQGLLFGVAAHDPLSLGAAPALLLVVAFAAAWLPARRTVGIAPASLLRD